jgi:outer membrane lipoprotein carrier protein
VKLSPAVAAASLTVASLAIASPAPKLHDPRLDTVLHAVEKRYNSAHTLSAKFTESYISGDKVRQTESGTLTLRKPGRMRWDYSSPAGKMFLSDGKRFYLYTPTTKRVEVTAASDTEDMHAPLVFLLGKLNFYKEFSGFELRGEGSDLWIDVDPNSPALPYSKVGFLVTPDSRIKRLRVTEDDLSVLDFTFDNEVLNARLDPSQFIFKMPTGAALEDNTR